MLLKRGIEIGSVNMIKLLAIWEIANGNILVLLIPKFIAYLLMTLMFSTFTLAIKFDCLFVAIFQSVHLFVSCIVTN